MIAIAVAIALAANTVPPHKGGKNCGERYLTKIVVFFIDYADLTTLITIMPSMGKRV